MSQSDEDIVLHLFVHLVKKPPKLSEVVVFLRGLAIS